MAVSYIILGNTFEDSVQIGGVGFREVMLTSFSQSSKACSAMYSNDSPSTIVSKLVQSLNALREIVLTEFGIVIDDNDSHLKKIVAGIFVTFSPINTSFKEEQLRKIPFNEVWFLQSIALKYTVSMLGQSANADTPSSVIPSCIVIDVKDLQLLKALFPMLVTDSGIETLGSFVQPENDESLMTDIELGIDISERYKHL